MKKSSSRRWIVWLAVAGVVVVVAVVLLMLPVRTDSATEGDVAGRWVSINADAPGELVLEQGGVARSVDLTFYNQRSKSEQIQASDVTADGTWTVVEGQVYVEFVHDGEQIDLVLFVVTSPLGGTSLEAIVGDPDAPRVVQKFVREP